MSPHRGSRRAGVTVVEVIVAIVVLAIGAIGLAGTNSVLMRLSRAGARGSRAAFVAQQKVETLQALAFSGSGCATLATGADTVGIYQRAWTVTTSGTTHQVQLTITYPTQPTRTRSDTIGTTIIC